MSTVRADPRLAAGVAVKMTFAMLRTAPPAGRFLYGDIALLSEDDDDDDNGSDGSGSEERSSKSSNSAAFRLSSSSPSAFHIKVNRKRKLCGGVGGGGGMDSGAMEVRHVPVDTSPPVQVHQRTAANARERDRTNSVNTAFTALRTLIPTEPADRYGAARLVLPRRQVWHRTVCVCVFPSLTPFVFWRPGSCQRSRRYVWPAATSVTWATCCSWARGSMTDSRATPPRRPSSTLTPPPAGELTNQLSLSTSVLSASATRGKW